MLQAGCSGSGCCSQAVIARDQDSSTDGQDHAGSLPSSLFLQNGIGNEPSLSPSQILRGSGSLPPDRLMVPAMCSLMLSSSVPWPGGRREGGGEGKGGSRQASDIPKHSCPSFSAQIREHHVHHSRLHVPSGQASDLPLQPDSDNPVLPMRTWIAASLQADFLLRWETPGN